MPFDQYRTVVAAIDRLTTQVGRVADAVSTPVVEEDDAPQTTGDDARQRAYDAVFAVIRSQPLDFLPTTVVERNALLWRAVHAALDAAPRTAPVGKAAGGN
ncbi:hypothetical protein ACPXCP_31180 [Streptomyces sp. DT20]|uniref:hypothetical protein n=1 Tax=Streptomyces sp. DT20 TaxID=3416519 RepID=UPI003CFA44BF